MSPIRPMAIQADSKILDSIVTSIKKSKTFFLCGHKNPDADVIGSQLALKSFIRRLGKDKEVLIGNHGDPPRNLKFLSGFNEIKNFKKVEGFFDVIITFESSGQDRLGNIVDLKNQGLEIINLDHHLHNPHFGTINYVEPQTSSTAEIIYKIFKNSGLPLNKEEATSLYTGLIADTGCFRYGNTTVQSHEIGMALIEAGAPVAECSENLYMNRTKEAVQILVEVLSGMKFLFDDKVALLKIKEDFFRSVHAKSDDLDEVVNSGLQMGSVMVSILLKEKTNPPEVKISLRSKGEFDVNKVATQLGGGGHRNASGCLVHGTLEEAEKIILEKIPQVLS